MAIDEAKFKKMKRMAEEARAKRDKASGQLEAAMDRLEKEFECSTIKEAEELLAELEEEAAEAERAYNEAAEKFDEKWGELIGD